tara:strand:- start:76 stop:186 length:111 start_codon:yes stop_codon:yes gene_type:complete
MTIITPIICKKVKLSFKNKIAEEIATSGSRYSNNEV